MSREGRLPKCKQKHPKKELQKKPGSSKKSAGGKEVLKKRNMGSETAGAQWAEKIDGARNLAAGEVGFGAGLRKRVPESRTAREKTEGGPANEPVMGDVAKSADGPEQKGNRKKRCSKTPL